MPPVIEWRRDPQHAGSAELRGVVDTPFLYVHPQDWPATTSRASSAARWRYSQSDASEFSVIANQLEVTVFGRVSYRTYASRRRAYRALPPAQQIDPWQGQEGTSEVYGPVLATGIQPSGFLSFDAFLRMNPASQNPTTVALDADVYARALGLATPFANVGMAQTTDAKAEILDHNGMVHRIRLNARVRFPWRQKRGRHRRQYTVIVPPGGEVKIGIVTAGLAYEVKRGVTGFSSLARIKFTILGAG